MSKEDKLEEFVRIVPSGSHIDQRRAIIDIGIGNNYGIPIDRVTFLRVNSVATGLPLGQHYHFGYSENFILANGSGELYVRAVAPGEKNSINSEIVVPETFIPIYYGNELTGVAAKIKVDSRDPKLALVRVVPGIAHTFVLEPNSVLIHLLSNTPEGFDPNDKSHYQAFPLI